MTFQEFSENCFVKLTDLRIAILKILWESSTPLKAYKILEELSKTKENAKPPTVYRVLEFLINNGVIHRLDSIQSYTLCCKPHIDTDSDVLMVCNICHKVTEVMDSVMHALVKKIGSDNHFTIQNDSIQIQGLCQHCNKSKITNCHT